MALSCFNNFYGIGVNFLGIYILECFSLKNKKNTLLKKVFFANIMITCYRLGE